MCIYFPKIKGKKAGQVAIGIGVLQLFVKSLLTGIKGFSQVREVVFTRSSNYVYVYYKKAILAIPGN